MSQEDQDSISERMHVSPDNPNIEVESQYESIDANLGKRERVMTEKGKQYQITLLELLVKAAISAWRRQSNLLLKSVTDSNNSNVTRNNRDSFQSRFDDLSQKHEELQGVKEDCSAENNLLASIGADHQQIILTISQRISEIESQKQRNKFKYVISQRSFHKFEGFKHIKIF